MPEEVKQNQIKRTREPMIKKHPNNNHYLRTQGGIWVRNPYVTKVKPYDINETTDVGHSELCVKNEFKNSERRAPGFSVENWELQHVVIVGGGVDVRKKLQLVKTLGKDVKIIVVNDGLNDWDVRLANRSPDLYVVNNPYPEATNYLPRAGKLAPRCLASVRTNSTFVEKYPSQLFTYHPTPSSTYHSGQVQDCLDDYRNPVAAAISFAARSGLKKLLLVACDASFRDAREGSEKLPNGMRQFPVYNQAHHMLDGLAYWLRESGVKVGDSSSGPKFDRAEYISDEQWLRFFSEDGKCEGRTPRRAKTRT
jgi:hypothetical protein